MKRAVLLLCPACPDETALATKMKPRGGVLARLADGPPAFRTILRQLAASGGTPQDSWLTTPNPAWIPAAATAGLAGVALLGQEPPPGEHGLTVNRADDLLDVPRVLVPRDGGCWHDHPQVPAP